MIKTIKKLNEYRKKMNLMYCLLEEYLNLCIQTDGDRLGIHGLDELIDWLTVKIEEKTCEDKS